MAVQNVLDRALIIPQKKYEDVTLKVTKIGNGYQVTCLRDGIPFAYQELGIDDAQPDATITTVAEHISAFFAVLEANIG